MTTYIAIGLDGRTYDRQGRGYTTRHGAQAAAERAGTVAVETRPLAQQMPHANDAAGWDRLRMASGCVGR